MDQRCEHTFVNKPFYKWFRKCAECGKRKIWTRIAKCTGCKLYCHRTCVRLNDRDVESTAQVVTDQDRKTVVTRSDDKDVQEPVMVSPPEEDVGDSNPANGDVVVEDRPVISGDASCAENFELAGPRSYATDDEPVPHVKRTKILLRSTSLAVPMVTKRPSPLKRISSSL